MSIRDTYDPRTYGAAGDGTTLDTAALQAAIDDAAASGGVVVLGEGVYLSGSLFLRSGVAFEIGAGAVLLAATGREHYMVFRSRYAGIMMEAPGALLNVLDARDVEIRGAGLIDGNGQYWWDLYWGADGHSGMVGDYAVRGLRWAVDYDAYRPRLIFVNESRDVAVRDVSMRRSPFWTVHLCFSRDLVVSGIRIFDSFGPSTDGIDIDSCERVLIEGCEIACGDDNIVVKSGRDADGRRVGRPSRHIIIRDCVIGEGMGIALGSDLSGGISDVEIRGIRYVGTDYGLRMKSSRARGGLVERITMSDLTLTDVAFAFDFSLNWFPQFNAIELPDEPGLEIPEWWRTLAEPVPADLVPTTVAGLVIRDVVSARTPGNTAPSRAFDFDAFPENPMTGVRFERMSIVATDLGRLVGVRDLALEDVEVSLVSGSTDDLLREHKPHLQFRSRA